MAGKKISDLVAGIGTQVASDDYFPFVDKSTNITKRLTFSELLTVPSVTDIFAPLESPSFTGTGSFADAVLVGSAGSSNVATTVTLNSTSHSGNGGSFIGKKGGVNTFLIGDTAAALGSGTGLINYVYNSAPWSLYTGGTLAMSVDSSHVTTFTGSVLINTAAGISVQNGAGATVGTILNDSGYFSYASNATNSVGIRLITDGATAIQIDNSQNVKLTAAGALLQFAPTAGFSSIGTSGTDLFFNNGSGNETRIAIAASGDVNIYQTGTKAGSTSGALTIGDPNTLSNSTGIYMRTSGEASFSTASSTGYFTWYNNGAERMRLLSDGSLRVGTIVVPDTQHYMWNTSTVNATLDLRNKNTTTSSDAIAPLVVTKGSTTVTAGSNNFIIFQVNDGGATSGKIATNGSSEAAFFTASDWRLKTDIQPIPYALSKLCLIKPVNFQWKNKKQRKNGFIAQDLYKVMPELVHRTDSGLGEEVPDGVEPWHMTDAGLIPYLVAGIQELKKEIDGLKEELSFVLED